MLDTNYKLRARSKWNWRDFETVRLEISVGQDYHEGEKLKLSMDWARENFKERYIILGDTTQRYNYVFTHNASEDVAYNIAKRKGDSWLERNKQHLHGIAVTRWDDWRLHPDFSNIHAQVLELYGTNAAYRFALKAAQEDFWDRKNYPESERERFFDLSKQYLLEETAVFAMAYETMGGVSAYPGNFLDMLKMFVNTRKGSHPEGLSNAHYVRLCFEKRKQAA